MNLSDMSRCVPSDSIVLLECAVPMFCLCLECSRSQVRILFSFCFTSPLQALTKSSETVEVLEHTAYPLPPPQTTGRTLSSHLGSLCDDLVIT